MMLLADRHDVISQSSNNSDWYLLRARRVGYLGALPRCGVFSLTFPCLQGCALFPGPPGYWSHWHYQCLLCYRRCGLLDVTELAGLHGIAARYLVPANHADVANMSFRCQIPGSFHEMPVVRTNRMSLRAAWSSRRGRPPCSEGCWGGKSGCKNC